MVSLERADIQGNILHGYGRDFPVVAYRFFEVTDADAGRAFLRKLMEAITNAVRWPRGSKPKTTTNVALTFAGLRALHVSTTDLDGLPRAFSEKMRIRAPRVLGDTGASAPSQWVDGLGTERSHVLVTMYGNYRTSHNQFKRAVARMENLALEHHLTVVHRQEGEALYKRREHFGWADGLSQPSVEGAGGSKPGHGVPGDDGTTWTDLKAGEFIHGYADEDGQTVGAPLLRNGTFMVYRKLYQDVVRFQQLLREEAVRYGENVRPNPPLDEESLIELIAAKVVGRWRNGVSIEVEPQRKIVTSLLEEETPNPSNDFRYFDKDGEGLICPRGAHIRRTNPRDALGWDGSLTRRHRILRRGMPYGDPLQPLDRTEDDRKDRGLIFVCLNADFPRQFEFIQSQWCNDGNAFGLGTEKDYLLGDNVGSGRATIQGRPPQIMRTPPDIVLTRGSEYLLVPGITTLKRLAGP